MQITCRADTGLIPQLRQAFHVGRHASGHTLNYET